MNVRSLCLENKHNELVNNGKTNAIPILSIVTHKIVHDGKILYHHVENSTVITSADWRNAINASSGGIGRSINRRAKSALSKVKSWNKRIIVANFSGNTAVTIIVHYLPVEGCNEAEEHRNQLAAAVKEVLKHNMLVAMGDFNAHLGVVVKYSIHKSSNSNGKLVYDFVEETGLFITSTSVQKKLGKFWTFTLDMSGIKSQVDYNDQQKMEKLSAQLRFTQHL